MKIKIQPDVGKAFDADLSCEATVADLKEVIASHLGAKPGNTAPIQLRWHGCPSSMQADAPLRALGLQDRMVVLAVNCAQVVDVPTLTALDRTRLLLERRDAAAVDAVETFDTVLTAALKNSSGTKFTYALVKLQSFKHADCWELVTLVGFLRRGEELELPAETDLRIARAVLKTIHTACNRADRTGSLYSAKLPSKTVPQRETKTSFTIRAHSEDLRTTDVFVTHSMTVDDLLCEIARAFFVPLEKRRELTLTLVRRTKDMPKPVREELADPTARLSALPLNSQCSFLVGNCAQVADRALYVAGPDLERVLTMRTHSQIAINASELLKQMITSVLSNPDDEKAPIFPSTRISSLLRQCSSEKLLASLGFLRKGEDLIFLPEKNNLGVARWALRMINAALGDHDHDNPLYYEPVKVLEEEKQKTDITQANLNEKVAARIQAQGGKRMYLIEEARIKEEQHKIKDYSSLFWNFVIVVILAIAVKTIFLK